MAQLRVTSVVLKDGLFKLEGEYYTLGRDPDNTIHLVHTSISKHHAMLTVDKGDFKLWDLHSTNGLIVNGEKMVIRHLKDGDRIRLGDVELLFEANGVTPTPPAAQSETQRMTLVPPAASKPVVPAPKLESPVPVVTPKPAPPTAPVAPPTPLSKAETQPVLILAKPPIDLPTPTPPVAVEKPAVNPKNETQTVIVNTPPPPPAPLKPVVPATPVIEPKVEVPTPSPVPLVPVVETKPIPPPQPKPVAEEPKPIAIVVKRPPEPILIPQVPEQKSKLETSPVSVSPPSVPPVEIKPIIPSPLPNPPSEESKPTERATSVKPSSTPVSAMAEAVPTLQPTTNSNIPTPKPGRHKISQRRLFAIILMVGLALLLVGYGFQVTACRFLGFIFSMIGFICLFFLRRSDDLIVHPTNSSVTNPPAPTAPSTVPH